MNDYNKNTQRQQKKAYIKSGLKKINMAANAKKETLSIHALENEQEFLPRHLKKITGDSEHP